MSKTVATLLENIEAYKLQRDMLEKEHMDEWVIFHDGEFAGAYADFQDAANDAVIRFGRGPYLLRCVGATKTVSLMGSAVRPIPGSHRPISNA